MSLSISSLIENFIRRSPHFVQKKYYSVSHRRQFNRWEASGKPLPPPRLVKENIILKHRSSSGYTTLIETGTYLGDMVFAQLGNFKRIYSIELDTKLFEKASKRFRGYPQVTILRGDSGKVLEQILEQVNEPAIFWLDGHYSGGITAMGEKVTPIFEELRIIFRKKMNHIILIDDARLFNGCDGYPDLEELKSFIRQTGQEHELGISDDCIQLVLKNSTP